MDSIREVAKFIADHQVTLHELITTIQSIPGVFYGSLVLLLLGIYKPTRPFVIGGIIIGIFFI